MRIAEIVEIEGVENIAMMAKIMMTTLMISEEFWGWLRMSEDVEWYVEWYVECYMRKLEISRDSRDRRGRKDSNDGKDYDDNAFNLFKSI